MKNFFVFAAALTLTLAFTACTEDTVVNDDVIAVERQDNSGSSSCQTGFASCETAIDEADPGTAEAPMGAAVSCGDSEQSRVCAQCKNGGKKDCCLGSSICTVCDRYACFTDPPFAACSDKPCNGGDFPNS